MQSPTPADADNGANKRWAAAGDDHFSPAAVHADMAVIFRTLPPRPIGPMLAPLPRPRHHRPRTGPLLAATIVIAAVVGFMAGFLVR